MQTGSLAVSGQDPPRISVFHKYSDRLSIRRPLTHFLANCELFASFKSNWQKVIGLNAIRSHMPLDQSTPAFS